MKRAILLFLWALVIPVMATPQVSDADLKAAQFAIMDSPDGATLDCKGARVVLPGTVSNLVLANSGEVDATGVTTYVSFIANSHLIITGSAFKSGDASALFSAIAASDPVTSGSILLWLSGDGITGTVNIVAAPDGYGPAANLSNNNLSGVNLSSTLLWLRQSGVQGYMAGGLDFSNNPTLVTVAAGDGTTSGIAMWNTLPVSFNGDALSNASEDSLLDAGVNAESAAPGQVGNIDISGGSNAVPDEAGAADIEILVSSGWTITTN